MEKRDIICITCPIGCELYVTIDNGKVIDVKGNSCKRGITYANAECLNPTRMLTTSIVCDNDKVVSVKTQSAIPKNLINQAISEISKVKASCPIKIGDVLIKDILGTGVDIVATRNVL